MLIRLVLLPVQNIQFVSLCIHRDIARNLSIMKHLTWKPNVVLAIAIMFVVLSCSKTEATQPSQQSVSSESVDQQTIPASRVPTAVIESFNTNFPDATNVTWERKSQNGTRIYEATFTRDGQRWEARFLPDGTLIRVRKTNSGSGS